MLTHIVIFSLLFSLSTPSHAQSCANYNFASNQIFTSCIDLPYLNSFLHWNYDQSAKSLKMAYRQAGVSSSGWVAWAINPAGQGMIGAQSLVAFQKSDGTMRVYTTPITRYQTQLQQGDLSFPVSDLSATYVGNEIIIFATLKLDSNLSSSKVNLVWQEGPVSGDSPAMHLTSGPNARSMGTVDLVSADSGTIHGSFNSQTKKKNIQGLLNAVSWGIMMPIGVLFARYLKVFPSVGPVWFYLHALCQTSAYIIGVAGWASGFRLGSRLQYTSHRIIGIVLFCLGTLQVFALLLRPRKDHKYRFYWNIYHHLVGYSVIVLSIINIFKGLDILNPEEKWKIAYIGTLICTALVIATLEVYTWRVAAKTKTSSRSEKVAYGVNETNGYNGYGVGA